MTRDDIILGALRLTTRYSAEDTVPVGDMANCAQSLNILCKEMATEGLPLWCVVEVIVPMLTGVSTYNLSIASSTKLPIRILDCFIRNGSGSDVAMAVESRYDYNTLGQKQSLGQPNQVFYDPQLGGGTLTVYSVPADNLSSLHVTIQRQIQDINLATDNPDFPQEAFRMLKWCLADEIALEYNTPPAVRAEISGRAVVLRKKFFDYEQEQVSVTFTPTSKGMGQGVTR